ncbi:hypothetical protein DMC30DRAFT_386381 [Rhodotorula diobovata]|uniref:Uncharacterized protein n=1 Tax=Rhodotorula diobovata TaxID=5288 RepID=A0A5C5G8T2_9BASI|nr:hypothetical protein DMC30DRAFT_386381 [Rhodotorula diobovata]
MPASTRIRPSAPSPPPPPQPPLHLPLPRSLLSCSSAERLTCTTSLLSRPPLLHHCTFFSNAQRSLARFPLLTARTSGRHARLALYDGRRAGCRRPHWSGTPAWSATPTNRLGKARPWKAPLGAPVNERPESVDGGERRQQVVSGGFCCWRRVLLILQLASACERGQDPLTRDSSRRLLRLRGSCAPPTSPPRTARPFRPSQRPSRQSLPLAPFRARTCVDQASLRSMSPASWARRSVEPTSTPRQLGHTLLRDSAAVRAVNGCTRGY